MDYTTNYHLPQWVESDRIMMEDFNEAMAAIDDGIKEAQDTADSSAAAAKTAQNAANKAQETADKNCWFKLSELRYSTAGTHSMDLSGIDLSQYCKLVLEYRLLDRYLGATIYINNDRGNHYYGFSASNSNEGLSLEGSGNGPAGGRLDFYPGSDAIIVHMEMDTLGSYGGTNRTYSRGYDGCQWNGMSSLAFESSAEGEYEYILYGIRK